MAVGLPAGDERFYLDNCTFLHMRLATWIERIYSASDVNMSSSNQNDKRSVRSLGAIR